MSNTAGTPSRVNSLRKADGALDEGARPSGTQPHDRHGSQSHAQNSTSHGDLETLEKHPNDLKLSNNPRDVDQIDIEARKTRFKKVAAAATNKVRTHIKALNAKTIPISNIDQEKFLKEAGILMAEIDKAVTKFTSKHQETPAKILLNVENWQGSSKLEFVKAWNNGIDQLAELLKTTEGEVAELGTKTTNLLEKVKKAEA